MSDPEMGPSDANNSENNNQPHARQESGLKRVISNLSGAASRTSKEKTAAKKEIYPVQDLDKGIVGWEGQNDPQNPRLDKIYF
jgi:hypothetical protein